VTTIPESELLSVHDHYRHFENYTYVYPVVSRRAGGVSLGINLNPNHACNWQCVYCQVPNLTRGMAPVLNVRQLESELNLALTMLIHTDFMQQHVGPEMRVLSDIAFSGDGEPTSCIALHQALEVVEELRHQYQLPPAVKTRLITNGSLMHRKQVLDNIAYLQGMYGEVWFKLDAGTRNDIQRINHVHVNPQQQLSRLRACTALCPTWVQTCVFAWHGLPPDVQFVEAYLNCLAQVRSEIEGVYVYGVARPSHQPEAPWISAVPKAWLADFAHQIRQLGITVQVSE
jgi:wyosine [tRNA(Phe)-imidazoG37] synthetase (radical SAM superfamily)